MSHCNAILQKTDLIGFITSAFNGGGDGNSTVSDKGLFSTYVVEVRDTF